MQPRICLQWAAAHQPRPQFDPNRPLRGFNPSPPLTWQLIEALVENLGLSWIFKAGIAQLSTFQDSTVKNDEIDNDVDIVMVIVVMTY